MLLIWTCFISSVTPPVVAYLCYRFMRWPKSALTIMLSVYGLSLLAAAVAIQQLVSNETLRGGSVYFVASIVTGAVVLLGFAAIMLSYERIKEKHGDV